MMFASTKCFEEKKPSKTTVGILSFRGGQMDPEENINKEREEGQASVKLRNYRRLTKIQGLRPSVTQVMKLMKVT